MEDSQVKASFDPTPEENEAIIQALKSVPIELTKTILWAVQAPIFRLVGQAEAQATRIRELEASQQPAKPLTPEQEQVVPASALYWYNASLKSEKLEDREFCAREAYKHIVGALYAAKQAATPVPTEGEASDDLLSYHQRQIEWSGNTFGPSLRTKGVLDHIRKELNEIEAQPHDLSEWIDVVILAMDGFWRHGGKAEELMPALLAKQAKNFTRAWPDWRTMSEDKAIEHDRSGESAAPVPPLVEKGGERHE